MADQKKKRNLFVFLIMYELIFQIDVMVRLAQNPARIVASMGS